MGSLESDTTEQLHFHFSLSCIGEGNGNSLQCSCLKNPRDGGAWWAAVYGVTQSWTRLKRLSSSSILLFVTPWTVAHKAPLSMEFSRQETGMGCHFLLQCMKVKSESEVVQSCPTLSDPMDCSLPGSSIHGIFQTRVLEWGAIAFSGHALLEHYISSALVARVQKPGSKFLP